MTHHFKSTRSPEELLVKTNDGLLKVSISVNRKQYAGVHLTLDQAKQLKDSIGLFIKDLEN